MAQSIMAKTSADKTAIGFDYQYYFFLWKILSLRTGETIGWEVKDDVHIETKEQDYFYQIKHSVQKKSSGKTVNLTTLDIDLWKTLSSWTKVITDKNDGRETEEQQLSFLEKTTFILTSNKSSSPNNELIKCLVEIQNNTIDFATAKETILKFKSNTENKSITQYIETFLDINDAVLQKLFLKINFEIDEQDIFAKCKDAIRSDKILYRIDDVFSSLDSAIRKDNFITISNDQKVTLSFDDFWE